MIRQKDGFQGERQIVLPPVIVEMERKDPLVSSLYVTDIGYYPNATNHYRARKQPIDQYVLIYCVRLPAESRLFFLDRRLDASEPEFQRRCVIRVFERGFPAYAAILYCLI